MDNEEQEEETPKDKKKVKKKITMEKKKFLDETWARYIRLKRVYEKLLIKVTNCINFPEKSDLSFTSIPYEEYCRQMQWSPMKGNCTLGAEI